MKIQFDEITVSTRTRNISVFDGEKDVIINKKDFEKVKTPEGAIPISKWIGNLDKLKITGRTEHKVNSTDLQKETAGKYQDVPAMPFAELQAYNFDPSKYYRIHINQDCMNNTGSSDSPLSTFLKSKTNIVETVIDNGVTEIGRDAFKGCSSLTSITIPDSVTSISMGAFTNCSSLTSINIPDGVIKIWDFAFNGCSGLTSITIGDSVTTIGSGAFAGCSKLTSINIPDSVTYIGRNVFENCSSLTDITYNGIKEQWNAITDPHERFPSGCIIHCTDGDINIQ